MSSFINKVLSDIHLVYPSVEGKKQTRDTQEFKVYNEKLEQKINEIIVGKVTPWSTFVQQVDQKFDKNLKDLGYIQFPSYIAKLALNSEINSDYSLETEIVICVSLLSAYYSVFFQDTYRLTKYGDGNDIPFLNIIYSELKRNTENDNIKKEIMELLQTNFPAYAFINHKTLFVHKFTRGFPFTEDASTEGYYPPYTPYTFLFDGFFKLENTTVLD